MSILFYAAFLLLSTAAPPPALAQTPLSCTVQAAGTPFIRAEGKSELVGDILITCNGGTPAAANENLRQVNFQIFTQPAVSITSRPLASASTGNFVEAMLAVDEPSPANQVLCGSTAYPYSAPAGLGGAIQAGICAAHSGTGTGINTYNPGTAPNTVAGSPTYRGNLYHGRQISANAIVFDGIPFDPPGTQTSRLIRITNVRVDATQLGAPAGGQPVALKLFVTTSASGLANPIAVPLSSPDPTVASAAASLGTSVDTVRCGAGTCACRDAANPPAITSMNVKLIESRFPSSWRRRNDARPAAGSSIPPPPIVQNTLGVIYQTESGFYNPGFPGVYAGAGLAAHGTRLYVRFTNVPAGVKLSTPDTIASGATVARRVVTDADGAGSFLAASGDAQGNVEMVSQGGGLQAIYEIVDTDTTFFDSLSVSVLVSYSGGTVVPLTGLRVDGGYAPYGGTTQPLFGVFAAPFDIPGINPCGNVVPPPPSSAGLYFVPVTPCRLVDTREPLPNGLGMPAMAREERQFLLPAAASCGLPSNARAYSLNITVVPFDRIPLGYLTTWPSGRAQPFVSTLNAIDGRIKANAAIVPAGTDGRISVITTDPTNLVIDVNGYFVDAASNPQALAFYALPPCRIADTRNANGTLGGPVIAAGGVRTIPVLSANCGVPASAKAYSLNATVVPGGNPLGYLTLWPTGQAQPFVSTLNSPKGEIVANAAIVPAGANGSVNAFAQGQTHLVLDINGYFAPPGGAGAQRYFTVTPCRLLDTREPQVSPSPMTAGESRNFGPLDVNCGLAAAAAAYSLNATVVPPAGKSLGFLTLWPAGQARPFVSTLNVITDPIVANAAIVPAGTAGAISLYATDPTHVILDVNGFFAP